MRRARSSPFMRCPVTRSDAVGGEFGGHLGKFPNPLMPRGRLADISRGSSAGHETCNTGVQPRVPRTRGRAMKTQISVTQWVSLVEAEYREMPGLKLTKPQMRRLWGMDTVMCDALVDSLVAARVLQPTPSGAYVSAGNS